MKPNKYKYIVCDNCRKRGGVFATGRAFGNHGKKEFQCLHCLHRWQYGK